jgi:NAD(P)-dependent dehydrogenase (short-subunit alcohol dehydrogenase family)
MKDLKLENKVVLITGGTSGIGYETAREAIIQGAKVIITGRNEMALVNALKELGENAKGVVADSGEIKDIEKTMAFIKTNYGKLDVLFYNAGIALFKPLEDFDLETYQQIFQINTQGAFFTMQKSLPLLTDGARIILNGSINAHIGMPTASVYAASKAALISYAKNITAELIGRKIRVNVVSPGPVETPIYGKFGMDQAGLDKFAKDVAAQIPLGRFGKSSEIAKVVCFLASEDSEYIVGTEIIVDGGMSQL